MISARKDRSDPLTWIEIGSMSGLHVAVRSEWLRAARLALLGSGQGSIRTSDIVAELQALAAEISTGRYVVGAVPTPLRQVRASWNAPVAPGQRIVFVP